MNEETRALVKDIAFEAARTIGTEINEQIKTSLREVRTEQAGALALHAATCPTGDRVKEIVAKGRGVVATVALLGALLGAAAALVAVLAFWKN